MEIAKINKWHKMMNIYGDTTINILLAGGFLFLLTPIRIWPDFYSPTFFGAAAFVSILFIHLPSRIFKPKNEREANAVMFLRFAVTNAIVLNVLGELRLYQFYKEGFQYDKVIHFFTPLFFIIAITIFLEAWYRFNFQKALVYSIVLVIVGGLAWEVFEYTSDLIFKTKEFGVYGQNKLADTFFDIVFDLSGALAGVILLRNKNFYNKIVIFDKGQREMPKNQVLGAVGQSNRVVS